MKYLDKVKVLSDKYEKYGINKGDIGHIMLAEIRYGTFCFYRENPKTHIDDGESASIKIEDLEVIWEADYITNKDILEALPKHDPNWWCKVEDGYILNLNGERKNKMPYDYNS